MKQYDYILWDWNGTILDDLEMNIELENDMLAERGIGTVVTRDFYLEHFDFPIIDFYKLIGYTFENETYEQVSDEYMKLYCGRIDSARVFEDVPAAIELFKRHGAKQVIISASDKGILLSHVEHFGLTQSFDGIFGIDNCLGHGKTAMAGQWLSREGACIERTLFIGDTLHDSDTAAALGCDCVLISRGHCSHSRLARSGRRVFPSLGQAVESLGLR